MSIIIRDPIKDKIILFTKGADSYLLPNLDKQLEEVNETILVKDSLEQFSKEGLRTLVLGKRDLSA